MPLFVSARSIMKNCSNGFKQSSQSISGFVQIIDSVMPFLPNSIDIRIDLLGCDRSMTEVYNESLSASYLLILLSLSISASLILLCAYNSLILFKQLIDISRYSFNRYVYLLSVAQNSLQLRGVFIGMGGCIIFGMFILLYLYKN